MKLRIREQLEKGGRVLRLPIDLVHLTVDWCRGLVWLVRTGVQRLFRGVPSSVCPFGPIDVYGRAMRCRGGAKYTYRFVFHILCPAIGPGEVDDPSPTCCANPVRWPPSAVRVILVGLGLAVFWGGLGYAVREPARATFASLLGLDEERETVSVGGAGPESGASTVTIDPVLADPSGAAPEGAPEAAFLGSAARYLRAGDWPSAMIEYRNAIQVAPANAVAHYGKGFCFLQQGSKVAARSAFEEAVRLDPGMVGPRDELVKLLREEGRMAEAAPHVLAVAAARPDDTELRMLAAQSCVAAGDLTNALVNVQAVVGAEPANIEAVLLMAEIRRQLDDLPGVKTTLDEALARTPGDPRLLVALARVARAEGRMEEAGARVAEALAASPTNAVARLEAAELNAVTGTLASAVAAYRELSASEPGMAAAQERLAELLLMAGQDDEALQIATRLMRARVPGPRMPLVAATALLRSRLWTPAAEYAEAALQIAPETAAPYNLLARALLEKGRGEDALLVIERGLNTLPGNLGLLLDLARLHNMAGRKDEALAVLEMARELHPGEAQPHLEMGIFQTAAGRADEAVTCYEKVLEIDPRHAVAANNLAHLLLKAGRDVGRAVELARTAHDLRPWDPLVADTYALACLAAGDFARAVEASTFAVRTLPRAPMLRFHLARGLAGLGQREQAKLELEAAFGLSQTFEGDGDARRLLDELNGDQGA